MYNLEAPLTPNFASPKMMEWQQNAAPAEPSRSSHRRPRRRRSSRIGKSSAKAIRSIVTKISTAVDPVAQRPLFDSDSGDEGDKSVFSLSGNYRMLNTAASDDKSDTKSCLSFSDLRPTHPVHVDVSTKTRKGSDRKFLRKPSRELIQKVEEEGLLGYEAEGECWPNRTSTALRKPSMDLMKMGDEESLFEEEDNQSLEELESSRGSLSSSMSSFKKQQIRPSLDLMQLAETEGLLEDSSRLDNWDDASSISKRNRLLPRSDSMDLMKQVEDQEDDDEAIGNDVRYFAQETNTRIQVSPESTRMLTRLPPPERFNFSHLLPPRMVAEAKKMESTHSVDHTGTHKAKSKSKRSSKTKLAHKAARRNDCVDKGTCSDDVPSPLSPLYATSKEDSRRSSRSEASRRSVAKATFHKAVRKEERGKSRKEMKDSSIRKEHPLEMKDASARRASRTGMQETRNTSVRQRSSHEMQVSSERRNSPREMNDSAVRIMNSSHMRDSSARGTGSREMKDSSRRKNRRTSSREEKESLSARRARRISSQMTDSSKSRRSSSRQTLMLTDSSTNAGACRSRVKERETKCGRRLSRRNSGSTSSDESQDKGNERAVSRSLSCTREDRSNSQRGLTAGHSETTSSKRLSRRNSFATPSTVKKDEQTRNCVQRMASHEDEPTSRRTPFFTPSMEMKARKRDSSRRRSKSFTPTQKKQIVDLESLVSLKIAREPGTIRSKSTSDGQKGVRQDEKGNNSQRRHTTISRGSRKDEEALLVVEPLQLVVESISAASNHTRLSCEKTAFPAHSNHDDDDPSMKDKSQRSAWRTHDDLAGKDKSQHSALSSQDDLSKKDESQHSAWSRSFSTVLRAPKQFRHQKPSTRAEVFNESFMTF